MWKSPTNVGLSANKLISFSEPLLSNKVSEIWQRSGGFKSHVGYCCWLGSPNHEQEVPSDESRHLTSLHTSLNHATAEKFLMEHRQDISPRNLKGIVFPLPVVLFLHPHCFCHSSSCLDSFPLVLLISAASILPLLPVCLLVCLFPLRGIPLGPGSGNRIFIYLTVI